MGHGTSAYRSRLLGATLLCVLACRAASDSITLSSSSFVFFAPSSSTTSSVLQQSKGSGSEDVSHVFVNAMKLLDPNVLYSKIVEEATGQWLAGPAAKAALGN
jgi:hypothetical protein